MDPFTKLLVQSFNSQKKSSKQWNDKKILKIQRKSILFTATKESSNDKQKFPGLLHYITDSIEIELPKKERIKIQLPKVSTLTQIPMKSGIQKMKITLKNIVYYQVCS